MLRPVIRALALVALLGVVACGRPPVGGMTDQEALVDRARITVQTLRTDPSFSIFQQTLANARGVLIIPELYRAGFVFGGEGGRGVLLLHQAGGWTGPAFYTIAGGSFGLQIGGQVSELVLALMTDTAVEAVRRGEVTLGADVSAALITIGAGLEARTAFAANADMYAFSRNQGLFAGGTIEGNVIREDNDYNRAYYGGAVSSADILSGRVVQPQSAGLRAALP